MGVDRRERPRRHAGRLEDHVAVVRRGFRLGRGRRPLVGDERREGARIVVALGGHDDVLPSRAVRAVVERGERAGRVVRHPRPEPLPRTRGYRPDTSRRPAERPVAGLLRPVVEVLRAVDVVEGLGARQLAGPALRVRPRGDDAQEDAVVGDAEKVEGLAQPHLVAEGIGDGLALGVAIALVRRHRRTEAVRVKGVTAVDVQVAEVDVALGVVAGGAARLGRRRHTVVFDA